MFLRMSIIVDEDKLQVLPSKGREKEEKTDLRGSVSHPLIYSEKTFYTVHSVIVCGKIDQGGKRGDY